MSAHIRYCCELYLSYMSVRKNLKILSCQCTYFARQLSITQSTISRTITRERARGAQKWDHIRHREFIHYQICAINK